MRRTRISLILVMLCLSIYTSAFAQMEEQTPKLFMVYLDWDAYHAKMVDRCNIVAPESVESIRTAIAQWDKANRAALQEVRQLIRDKMVRERMVDSDVDARSTKIGSDVTQFMIRGVSSSPEAGMKKICAGEYTEQLASPEMSYASLRDQLKSEPKR